MFFLFVLGMFFGVRLSSRESSCSSKCFSILLLRMGCCCCWNVPLRTLPPPLYLVTVWRRQSVVGVPTGRNSIHRHWRASNMPITRICIKPLEDEFTIEEVKSTSICPAHATSSTTTYLYHPNYCSKQRNHSYVFHNQSVRESSEVIYI